MFLIYLGMLLFVEKANYTTIRQEQKCVCVCVCVFFTVEALLVDYGTAGQGFIVLLVAH